MRPKLLHVCQTGAISFFFTLCVRADPATDLTAFEELLERSNLDAVEATFLLVVSLGFFAIGFPARLSRSNTHCDASAINCRRALSPTFIFQHSVRFRKQPSGAGTMLAFIAFHLLSVGIGCSAVLRDQPR